MRSCLVLAVPSCFSHTDALSNMLSAAKIQVLSVEMCQKSWLQQHIRMLLTTRNLTVYVSHSNGCYGGRLCIATAYAGEI